MIETKFSKYDVDYYLSKIEEIHDDKYQYPLIRSEFKNSCSKITIFCKKCKDIFSQSLSHHIWSVINVKILLVRQYTHI